MAYVDPVNQDEEDKKDNAGISTTPETSIISDSGPQSAGPVSGGGQKGWTNLQTYVGANEEQSGKMGQDVSKGISNKIQNIEDQKTQYNNAYSANRPAYDTRADASVLEDISKGNINSNKDKIANLYNAQYKGPNSAQDVHGYQDISSGYQDAGVKATNLNDESGRAEALKSTYGQGRVYTPGEQSLDSFILGAGDQGRQALQNTQDLVNNSKNSWKKTLADVGADISNNQRYSNDIRNQTQQAVSSKLGDYGNQFSSQKQSIDNENASKIAELSMLQDQLKNSPTSTYDKFGLDQPTANFLTQNGFDFNSLYNANGQRSLGDVVNGQDANNYNALAQIANKAPGFDFSKSNNSANSYNVDSSRVQQGQQAQQLSSVIQQRLQEEQAKRDAALASVRSAASPLPNTASRASIIKNSGILGISADDYQKALDNNIDLSKYVQAGKNLTAGDIASNQERSQWDSLRGALGLGSSQSLEDTQDEGSAYSLGDIVSALNAIQPIQNIPSARKSASQSSPAILPARLGVSNILTPQNNDQVLGDSFSTTVSKDPEAYKNIDRNKIPLEMFNPMLGKSSIYR